jgi:hypothetical protein
MNKCPILIGRERRYLRIIAANAWECKMRDDYLSAEWAEHHKTLTDGMDALLRKLLRVLLFWRPRPR